MLEGFMKQIKKMCKGCIDDEDMCIFVVAAVMGFLLCVFLKNNEPFQNFANLEEAYDQKPIGANDSVEKESVGMKPKKRSNEKVPPSLESDHKAMKASTKEYPLQNIQNKQGLMVQETAKFMPFQGWDQHGYAPVDLVLDVASVPKDMGKGPMGPDRPMVSESMTPPPSSDGEANNELKIVLIYADWCGHSKKMLPDFAKIEAEFHNKKINDTLVTIEKYTDKNREKVEEYGVKGFPTLFSHKNGQRSPLNERTYDGLKNHIMSNV